MKTDFCKKVYFNPKNQSYLIDLIDYLKQISGRDLKKSYQRQYLFKTSWKNKENYNRSRCHIKAASDYLNFLLESENTPQKITAVIADLKPYITYLDENEDLSFIMGNSNILHSTIHFHAAKNIFFNHQILKSHQNNQSSDLLVVYNLRLSLEKRIRAMLGIDFATSNGHPIGLSSFIEVLKEARSIKYSEVINWQEILLVNTWSNHFMHRHIRPYPWVIYQAIQVLEPLLNSKKPIRLKNGLDRYSFNSPGWIHNESEYEKEIENLLRIKFRKVKISFLNFKEVVIDD